MEKKEKKAKTCTLKAKNDGAIGPLKRRWMTANYPWQDETVCVAPTQDQSRVKGPIWNQTKLERHPSLDLPLFPSEASWNGRQSEGVILLLTRPQGIVPSAADSFQCHSVSSDPHSSNGVLRETALSRLLFHTLSFLTPPANPALFHWTHSERKMKTIPFCPMSHYPPQLIYKKNACKCAEVSEESYIYDLTPVSKSDPTANEPTHFKSQCHLISIRRWVFFQV